MLRSGFLNQLRESARRELCSWPQRRLSSPRGIGGRQQGFDGLMVLRQKFECIHANFLKRFKRAAAKLNAWRF
jgi:hypothetical protein